MSDVHVYGNQMPGPNIVAAPGSAHQHLRDCNSTDCLGPALDCSGMVVNSNGAGAGMIIEGGQYIRSIAKDENGVQYSERPAIEFDAYNRQRLRCQKECPMGIGSYGALKLEAGI
jgi:hypothetical protein